MAVTAILAKSYAKIPKSPVRFDISFPFNGDGFFSGIVEQEGRPYAALVQLIHNKSMKLVKSTTSGVDGRFSFTDNDQNEVYDIVATDPQGKWEKLVSSNRTPKVL